MESNFHCARYIANSVSEYLKELTVKISPWLVEFAMTVYSAVSKQF